jgi:hypothetical protein
MGWWTSRQAAVEEASEILEIQAQSSSGLVCATSSLRLGVCLFVCLFVALLASHPNYASLQAAGDKVGLK